MCSMVQYELVGEYGTVSCENMKGINEIADRLSWHLTKHTTDRKTHITPMFKRRSESSNVLLGLEA